MKNIARLLVVCVALLGLTYVFAQTLTQPDSPSFEQAQRYIEGFVNSGQLPGAVALIAHQGEVAHFEALGVRDLDTHAPMQTNTLFRLASMTKPIVSAAAMLLIENGTLKLEDPVAKFIPAFADVEVYVAEGQTAPLERQLTVKDLLTHTGGIASGLFHSPVDALYRTSKPLHTSTDLSTLSNAVASLPLAHQPGARWTYSYSVDMMARIIEVASGTPIQQFLQNRILDPLGMVDTHFEVPASKQDRLATLYTADDEGAFHARPYSSTFPRGNTGLFSTATDYYRFAQMLLNRGQLDGVQVLKPKTVDLMMRNHLPDALIPIQAGPMTLTGTGFGLGMGVQVAPYPAESGPKPGTNWWLGASGTYFWIDRENEMVAVLMTQVADPSRYPFIMEYPVHVFGALTPSDS